MKEYKECSDGEDDDVEIVSAMGYSLGCELTRRSRMGLRLALLRVSGRRGEVV